MFIRYVGSGYGGSKKGFGNRTKDRSFSERLFRGATVLLVVLLGFLLFTSNLLAPVRGVTIDRWVYEIIQDTHKHMVKHAYNMSSYYEHSLDKSNSRLVTVLNSQSNLYEYVNEFSCSLAGVQYSFTDPGYEKLFAHNDGVEEETTAKPPADSDAKEDETKQDIVHEESTETVVDDGTEGIEGYVVPATATTGVTYTLEQLSSFDFLMSKLYTVPARALVYESDLVAKDMLAKDMTMKNDNSKPQILIYHTHSQEGFVDSVAGDDSTTIVAVGAYLAKILSEEYGYNVIHCKEHFDMAGGSLDRSKAYTYAQGTIEQILEDNPSIEVILDIHRDGLPEGYDKLVTNIGGKDVAKIMLFNGVSRSSAAGDIDYLYNRYKADNLAFSFQLKLQAMECYPEFTRRNYIDAYQYNLHHRPKSVLVEVGAQNNTLQEELNAMEVFAEVLHRVLTQES